MPVLRGHLPSGFPVRCLPPTASPSGVLLLSMACLLGLPHGSPGQALEDTAPGGADARVAVSGDASVTLGPEDSHYFNYTDYDHSALRLFSGALGASLRITGRLSAVGELRIENSDSFRVSALYLRVRPFDRAAVAIQAGRIPPVFGAFSRYRYGTDNPLVSLPLAYQYLTTLRSDKVPASADALLAVRGQGWRVRYPPPGGEQWPYQTPDYGHGIPVVSTTRWDTGVQVTGRGRSVEGTVGLTLGSLSAPRVEDDNDGRQVVGRVVWQPAAAWSFGVSAARGEYLAREAAGTPGSPPLNHEPWIQSGLGLDVSFAAGHLQARGEVIASSWRVPVLDAPYLRSPLKAVAGTVEVQYRLSPLIDLAARGDLLTLSDIQGNLHGGRPTTWDANVSRIEFGGSYRLARRVRAKLVYQHDWRYGDRRVSAGYPAAQLSLWF